MLRAWLDRLLDRPAITEASVHDLPLTVVNTRPDIRTPDVVARVSEAFDLIARYTPHYCRHLQRDFAGVLVQRYACRGAFFPDQRICLVELTFTVNPDFTAAQVAATILHEGMHARLHALGFPLEMEDRARQERFCRRAEVEFGRLVPNGAAVIERALGTLAQSDDDVAPVIDEQLAAERIREVDRAALERRTRTDESRGS